MDARNIISAGPVYAFNGTKCPFRIVLRVTVNNDGRPTEFYTHKQIFTTDEGMLVGYYSFDSGSYFPVRLDGEKAAYQDAYQSFLHRLEQYAEEPLANLDFAKKCLTLPEYGRRKVG